ncbi:hypothetical protein FNH22_20275 [Fulvivirga sp. M361]|uniref:lipocalin family protein n=1 Tax=Fulvivirga sp. M361 TaxID=2594266 RepID=UPI00117A470A|nr:lipocalin family protein [Fulvivirga sp. M361]TRX53694.1 hypothetical protein FNH22_20275 [Fulvivirga sp. M361]
MRLLKTHGYFVTTKKLMLKMLFFSLLLYSCNDDDPKIIPTSLTLTVTQNGIPVNAINVVLYSSQQDWLTGQNPVASDETDATGEVIFNEDLSPVVYYVDVFKGDTTNWHTEVSLTELEENKLNKSEISVISSVGNHLTGKTEKSWIIKDALVDGFSIFPALDECEKDDILLFQRDEQLGLEDVGRELCPGETLGQFLFQWSLSNSEKNLTLTNEDGSKQEFTVESINPNTLGLILELDIEGVPSDVLFVLNPIE